MVFLANPAQWILGIILLLSSLGILFARKPIHASLSFLLTLLTLAAIYLQLSAPLISAIQIIVYAGAILVIFVFVMVLFQDAYQQISRMRAESSPYLLFVSAALFLVALGLLGAQLLHMPPAHDRLPQGFGTAQSIGRLLYVDFFFPFEAIILLFLVAAIGALYVGKKEK